MDRSKSKKMYIKGKKRSVSKVVYAIQGYFINQNQKKEEKNKESDDIRQKRRKGKRKRTLQPYMFC